MSYTLDLANQTGLVPSKFLSINAVGDKITGIDSDGVIFDNTTTSRSLGVGAGGLLVNGSVVIDPLNLTAIAPNPTPTEFVINDNVIIQNADTSPTELVSVEAGINGGVGTFFGIEYQSQTNQDFVIQTAVPNTGGVVFKQYGLGANTATTKITQGNIDSTDGTNSTQISPTEITIQDNIDDHQTHLDNQNVVCSANGNEVVMSNGTGLYPLGVQIDTIPVIPCDTLYATSNVPQPIPIINLPKYDQLLNSGIVSFQDKLQELPSATIASGEQILCNCWTGTYLFIGTSFGNIYYWDTGVNNWSIAYQFNAPVRALAFNSRDYNVWVGGDFTSQTSPASVALQYICIIPAGSINYSVSQPVFANNGANGFNNAVYSIWFDGGTGNHIYMGGAFTADGYYTTYPYNYFAIYNCSNQNCYSIDNYSSGGFNAPVYNVCGYSGLVAVSGQFSYLTSSSSYNGQAYYICFLSLSDYTLSNAQFVSSNPYAITQPISTSGMITFLNNYFYIGCNDANIGGSGANYVFYCPDYAPYSTSVWSNNLLSYIPDSLWVNPNEGIVYATQGSNIITGNGTTSNSVGITAPIYGFFDNYLGQNVYFSQGSTAYNFWSATGNNFNSFTFQAGRTMWYANSHYFGGINFTGGLGSTCLLRWDSTLGYYTIIAGVNYSPV